MSLIRVFEAKMVSGKNRRKVVIDFSSLKSTPELSAEEQIENLKIHDELELVFNRILHEIEFELEVENSGIGEFEFGSSREFDAGTDYLSIEGSNTKVSATIVLGDVSSIAGRNLLRDACLTKREVVYKDLAMNVKLSPVLSFDGGGVVTYKIGIE